MERCIQNYLAVDHKHTYVTTFLSHKADPMANTISYMKRALALAQDALGTTSPNPAVGAVLVRDGLVIGEGHTQPPSQHHAEVVAIDQAWSSTKGASLYVTLEPCCIQGRTPPCTDAIIDAGIVEVHAAVKDPNPLVNGKGLELLRSAGINVQCGEARQAAMELYAPFTKHINTKMPYVLAKFAVSLDGKIATSTGDSRWITSPRSRQYVHQMRKASDAIIVGVNTVIKDDPKLTVRDSRDNPLIHQPLRVIMDSKGRTPADSQLFKELGHTVVAVTSAGAPNLAALTATGAEILELPMTKDGGVDPCALLQALGVRGIVSMMIEGGGQVLGSFFDLDQVDKVVAFISPMVIGGSSAPSPVGGIGFSSLAQVARLEQVKVRRVGPDIMVVGYPPKVFR